jgi:hypothetical protein
MVTRFPYWDISWLVAVTLTLGSAVWVLNGFFVFLPLAQPDTEFPGEITAAGGWSALVGASIFFAGSLLLMLEALNTNRTGCFAWAVRRVVGNGSSEECAYPSLCQHHHHLNHNNLREQHDGSKSEPEDGPLSLLDNPGSAHYEWLWIPTWQDIKTFHIYETAFIACSIQLCAAFIYWATKFLGIPPLSEQLPDPVLTGAYYSPAILGGIGFCASSLLFMLETQSFWYMPAPEILGWHVGFWKLLGSLGFTVSAALGPAKEYNGQIEFYAGLATFCGSFSILIGSLIQWYESLDKRPVIQEGTHRWSEWQADSSNGARG